MSYMYENQKTTEFFTKKDDYYDKYRPDYDKRIIDILKSNYSLSKESIVVEYGCGTAKFSNLISDYVDKVYGIEPNLDMIKKAKEKIQKQNIYFLNEKAESTTLEKNSIDFAFAVHSFHYFNKEQFLKELQKVLKNSGYFCIIWYDYVDEKNEFSKEWQELMYERKPFKDNHNIEDERKDIYDENLYEQYEFVVSTKYNQKELLGLGLSVSSTPLPNDEDYQEFVVKVNDIFSKYNKEGYVTFDLHCNIQIGKIKR